MLDYNSRKKEIGKRVKAGRNELGLKPKEFLPRIYKSVESHKMLSDWENGNRLPDLDSLAIMAELFDCEIGYLLCDYKEKTREITDICAATGLSASAIAEIKKIKEEGGIMGLEILSQLITNPIFWNAIANLNYARFAADNSEKPMSDCLETALQELKMINSIERHPGATILSPEQMRDMNLYHAAQKFSECASQIVNRELENASKKGGKGSGKPSRTQR